MTIRFDGKVAIVTGAGGGLRPLPCARTRPARRQGRGQRSGRLGGRLGRLVGRGRRRWSNEIKAPGGEAIANGASVTDDAGVAHLVKQTMDALGRIDILIANAGILRDKSFSKMEIKDFDAGDGRPSDGHGEARQGACGRSCATSNMAASW